MKKALSILLALTLCLSLLPLGVLAEEGDFEEAPAETAEVAGPAEDETPAEEPEPEPDPEPAEAPAPAEEPVEEPVEEPMEEPAEKPVEEPVEEPMEEPAEDPALDGASVIASGICGDNLTWTLTEDGVLTITGSGIMYDYGTNNAAPWQEYADDINRVMIEDGVTSIGCFAFNRCSSMTDIVIPGSVTSIGDSAFSRCSALTSIALPDGVTSIGSSAFFSCSSLTSIVIPDSVTSIGTYAFYVCSALTDIKLSAGLTNIEDNEFNSCGALTSITIPAGVTSVGYYAFNSCSSLKEIIFEGKAPSIGSNSFRQTTATAYYPGNDETWTEDVRQDYGGTITWVAKQTDPAVQPVASGTCGDDLTWELTDDGVLTISGSGIMYDYDTSNAAPWQEYADEINRIVIEDGVTGIGKYAFVKCGNLTSVTIGDDVESIGWYAFQYCTSLTSMTFPEGMLTIGLYAFYGCSSLASVTIPASVSNIGKNAFNSCSSDLAVYISDLETWCSCTFGTSTVNGGGAFSYHRLYLNGSEVKNLSIPESITEIGRGVFYCCDSLETVTIHEGVTTVCINAFGVCRNLKSVSVPNSVTRIEYGALGSCSSLTDIYYNGTQSEWDTIYIDEENNETLLSATLHCGILASGTCGDSLTWTLSDEGVLTIYGSGNMTVYAGGEAPWYAYRSSIVSICVEEGVERIEGCAFQDLDQVTDLTLPTTLTYIDTANALLGCMNLKEIHVDDNSYYCNRGGVLLNFDGMTLIYYPNGLTASTYAVPADIDSIREGAFRNVTALSELDFHETQVNKIMSYTFAGFRADILRLPSCVRTIEDHAFEAAVIQDIYYSGTYSSWQGISVGSTGNDGLDAATIHFSDGSYLKNGTLTSPCGDDATWALTGDTLTISGSGDMYDYSSSSTAPWYSSRSSIKKVVIGDGITHIGQYAFYGCEYLNDVTFYASVASIGGSAFSGCYNLNNVYYYGTKAEWADMTVGSSNYCLTDMAYIRYLNEPPVSDGGTLSTGLTWTLENHKLTISGSGPMPDYDLLEETPPWSQYSDWNGSEITELEIGSGVTYIGSYSFFWVGITGVTIPASVTGIGWSAFWSCSSLQTVTIPDSVTEIGKRAFADCHALESVTLPAGLAEIPAGLFSSCEKLTSVVIPAGVTSIGRDAFSNSGLTSVTIPDSVTELGESAFEYCGSLTSATLGSGVTVLPDSLFNYCTSLGSVNIPSGVTSIGQWAFYETRALQSITIPRNVTEIMTSAFYDSGLTAGGSTYDGTAAEWQKIQIYGGNDVLLAAVGYALGTSGSCGPDAVWTVNGNTLTISGTGATYDYKTGSYLYGPGMSEDTVCAPWSTYNSSITEVVVESGITRIGDNLFNGSYASTVTLPETVTAIGEGSFRNCSNLTALQLPAGLVSLGDYALANTQLADIVMPESLTDIGEYALYGCSSLTSATLPRSVTSIAYGLFSWCSSLPAVDIPSGVTEIEPAAFSYCSSLTNVDIPSGVTEIGHRAFEGCTALTDVDIPDGVTSIDTQTFFYCTSLTRASLPAGLTSIGANAFGCCTVLSDISIPDTVTEIGVLAFENCRALPSANIPVGVTILEYGTFRNCTSLPDVTIPASVETIADQVFSGDTSLKTIRFDGSAPTFGCGNSSYTYTYPIYDFSNEYIFGSVTATAYYPADDATWTEAVMQDYGGTITWVPYGENPQLVTAQAASLLLDGTIGVNFKMSLSDAIVESPTAEAVFIYKDKEYPVSIAGMTPDDQGRYVFTYRIPAKEFANTIGLKFLDNGEIIPMQMPDGTPVDGNILNYSAQTYCEKVPADNAVKPLTDALWNYCAWAYKGLEDTTDTEPTFADDGDVSTVTAADLEPYRAGRTGSVEGLTLSTYSLTLETTTEVNLKFALASGHDIGEYAFTLDGAAVSPVKSGQYWVVTIPDIAAKNLDDMHTLTVTRGSEVMEVTCSGLSYGYTVLANNLLTAEMQNTIRALYLYNQAANAYFG